MATLSFLGCSGATPSNDAKPSETKSASAGSGNAPAPSAADEAESKLPGKTDKSSLNTDAGKPETTANKRTVPSPFTDCTASSGVQFAYNNGRSANEYAIVESLGGGLAVFDFDGDGNLDLMFAGGGRLDNKTITSKPCGLFRNLGRMRFQEVTAIATATADRYFTHGVFPADVDGDGFQDLSISGYGGVQIYLNQGDGTFSVQSPIISDNANAWSSSLAWADLDNNGLLDLYVAHYVDWSWNKHPVCPGQGGAKREVCAPREFTGMTDAVFFNDGQFPLRRESESVGLSPNGKGLGVVISDLNGDRAVDIYVANDTVDNFLYYNDGKGRFTESAVLSGVSGDDAGVSTGSMGVFVFDANQDTLPDIFVTNFERELSALYRNEGGGIFNFASRQAGFAAYEAGFVGFGTVPVDFDFDGDEDIVVANGHVSYHSPHAPYKQLPLLFENNAGYFKRVMADDYFLEAHTSRGVATGDMNNDGAIDLAFSHLEEPVSVLSGKPNSEQSWALVRLIGRNSNRDAVGAKVSAMVGGKTLVRYVSGGASYLSHCDRRVHLCWPGTAKELAAEIEWPDGTTQSTMLTANSENVVLQP